MILLELFLTFLKIGVVSFGGGYGMIALVRETVVGKGWMTDASFLNFLAVAESTPGPIAVNMATYIGSVKGGLPGSVVATAGVILPSLVIILLITILARNFMKKQGVQAFLQGVRPCVVALIVGTAATLGLKTLFGVAAGNMRINPNFGGLIILALVVTADKVFRHFKKKKPSPILLIVFSAGLGLLIHGVYGI